MFADVVAALLYVLLIMPFVTVVSLAFFVRMVKDAISPPILLVLLTIEATVSLITCAYFAALILNTRFLGNTNPPELVVVTLLLLIAKLATINVIAFVLWRSRR